MQIGCIILLVTVSCVFAQEKKVHHVSTELDPVSQMSASVKEEFKKFKLQRALEEIDQEILRIKEQERRALQAHAMACNKTQAKL